MSNYIKLTIYHREKKLFPILLTSALYPHGGTYSKAKEGTPGAGNVLGVPGRGPGWPLGEVGGSRSGAACGGRKLEPLDVYRESQKDTGAGGKGSLVLGKAAPR